LREELGLEIVEMPSVRATPKVLAREPERRAADIAAAFADPSIKAIFSSIGGEDSIRVLAHLDLPALVAQPKIVMGYSDTTTLLLALQMHGLVSFHGPAVMAGWSQARALPAAFLAHARALLFDAEAVTYPRYEVWCDGYPDWARVEHVGQVKPLSKDAGPRVLQGSGRVRGELIGGCVEVLEMLRGTPWFPSVERFSGCMLLLETSEDKPPPARVRQMLRSYGVAGILRRLSALLIGRPRDYSAAEKRALEREVRSVVCDEMGLVDLPIVMNLPFGHTDPQIILPLGVPLELDVASGSLRLLEPAVV
jgi:muramoyltetrapeptide carboxypeptidase LdcA involved in peptidoglycan recycling